MNYRTIKTVKGNLIILEHKTIKLTSYDFETLNNIVQNAVTVANNKYIDKYDPESSEEYIMYLDSIRRIYEAMLDAESDLNCIFPDDIRDVKSKDDAS